MYFMDSSRSDWRKGFNRSAMTFLTRSFWSVSYTHLADGRTAKVKLLDLQEKTDTMAHAVREARVKVEVNGAQAWLTSATYHLPQAVGGVQIDCPITRGYNANSGEDSWGLVKDARLRLWPAGAPWIGPVSYTHLDVYKRQAEQC